MIKIPSLSNKLIKNKYVENKNKEKRILDVDYNIIPKKTKFIGDVDIESGEDDSDINSKSDNKVYDIKKVRKEIERAVVKDIEDERKKILKIAKDQGESIKKEAGQVGYEEGYNLGLKSGYDEGMKKIKQEMKKARDQSFDMIDQAEKMVEDYLIENKKNIIDLAITMAESIVGFTIDKDSDGILNLIKPIISEYDTGDKITITCNGKRYDFLKEKLGEIEKMYPETIFFIIQDNNLDLNDCIIENEDQVIDLSIKKQLDSILSTIKHME